MRVVVADDSVLLREGVVRILESAGFEVVGQAGDGEELVRKAKGHKPDVCVVDVRMPPTHTDEGLVAAREIRAELPGTGVLVLSQYVEEGYAMDLLGESAEGVGYLLKDRVGDVDAFVDAVRRVAEGGSALDPEVVSQLLGKKRRDDPLDALTDRERAGAGADGRGPLELGDRGRAGRDRSRRRKARHVDLLEARSERHARGPPPRARGAGVPARLAHQISEASAAASALTSVPISGGRGCRSCGSATNVAIKPSDREARAGQERGLEALVERVEVRRALALDQIARAGGRDRRQDRQPERAADLLRRVDQAAAETGVRRRSFRSARRS